MSVYSRRSRLGAGAAFFSLAAGGAGFAATTGSAFLHAARGSASSTRRRR